MTLEEFSAQFVPLPPQEKIRFIYTHIDSLEHKDRVVFLLSILKEENSSPLVKATALKFLREASFQESDVYQAYLTDDFRAIANAARRAVKEFEEKEKKNGYYADAVLRKLRSLPDKERRLKILRAIARLKAPWVFRVLLEALKDTCETNRDFVIKELSHREIWNLAPLLEKLHQPPWYIKSSVLKILSLRKETQALSDIAKVIDDPNVGVRRSAAETLGEIGGQEAVSILVKLAKDRSAYVRQAAAEALRKTSRVRFSG
jgi:hypothetical protein